MTLVAAIGRVIGIRRAFAIAFAIAAIIAFWRLDAERDRAKDFEQAYFQLQAEYKTAQAEAARLAREARQQQEQRYRDLQEQSDARLAEAESEAQSRADDFIRRNRLSGKACSPSGGTGASTGSGGAQVADRPDPDAELVAVPATDVKICTTLHTRLTEARDWALSLGE